MIPPLEIAAEKRRELQDRLLAWISGGDPLPAFGTSEWEEKGTTLMEEGKSEIQESPRDSAAWLKFIFGTSVLRGGKHRTMRRGQIMAHAVRGELRSLYEGEVTARDNKLI